MKFKPIGHFNPNIKEVDIVGAGISGLSLGYFLSKKGFQVNLFEKSDRIAGKIVSEKTPNGIVEKAANTLLLNQELKPILEELNLECIEAVSKLKKQVFLETRKINFRLKIKLIIMFLLGIKRKIPTKANNLQEFFTPLIGKYFSSELISTVLGGIYGVSSKNVSPQNLFPLKDKFFADSPRSYFELFRYMRNQTSGKKIKKMISFSGGMEDLPKKFFEKTNFKSVHLNHNYQLKNESKKNVILCTNALQAAELLGEINPSLSELLNQTKYQALNTTTYFLSRPISSLKRSFGMLFSPNSNFYSLGVLSRSEIFNLSGQNSYNFISSGIISTELVNEDFTRFSSSSTVIQKSISKWSDAIPIMDHKQFNRLDKMKENHNNYNDNILLFSHYLGGISLRDIILSAKKFSSSL
ncbi:NAD(P)-binding protein [Bacteriovoracaceae bacterium]|nr:NAD(P)-binding protein [Bacteriovoracaceae bacterium]